VSVLTKDLLSRSNLINAIPEVSPGAEGWEMFNSGGVEVEVAELLFSFVRCWKPSLIVETGTHLGISSAYMGQALRDNGGGRIETYEVIPSLKGSAEQLWTDLKLSDIINCNLQSSLDATLPEEEIDFLFLDSEPHLRFDEFIKFWPKVREGGLIAIHDLHPNLGHHGQTHHKTYDWPYGFWEPKLGEYVLAHNIQTIHIPNPRGMTLFQKTKDSDENIRLLRGRTAE
jgi:predicted O-methyltransferase YrrM